MSQKEKGPLENQKADGWTKLKNGLKKIGVNELQIKYLGTGTPVNGS